MTGSELDEVAEIITHALITHRAHRTLRLVARRVSTPWEVEECGEPK